MHLIWHQKFICMISQIAQYITYSIFWTSIIMLNTWITRKMVVIFLVVYRGSPSFSVNLLYFCKYNYSRFCDNKYIHNKTHWFPGEHKYEHILHLERILFLYEFYFLNLITLRYPKFATVSVYSLLLINYTQLSVLSNIIPECLAHREEESVSEF